VALLARELGVATRRSRTLDDFVAPDESVEATHLGTKEHDMGQVIASASMSLDGYIAKHDNTIGRLFDWLQNGQVELPTVNPDITLHVSPRSAEYFGGWLDGLGALVCGRTLFDFTGGWDGTHTMDVPVVVVTHHVPTDWVEAHPDAPFHFVTDGVEAAVVKAQDIAGGRTVAVTAGTIARQCLEVGVLDAVAVDLVPVVMGRGRPFFGELSMDDVSLGDPTVCIQGNRVTHLLFPVTERANKA
jgi:dihydrofolate reductase